MNVKNMIESLKGFDENLEVKMMDRCEELYSPYEIFISDQNENCENTGKFYVRIR